MRTVAVINHSVRTSHFAQQWYMQHNYPSDLPHALTQLTCCSPHRLSGSRDDENTQREARASLHTCDVIKRHGFQICSMHALARQTEKARGILAHVFTLSPNYFKRKARWKSFNGTHTNCFTKRFNVTFCG